MHKIVGTKKGRFIVMVQDPAKIGKFGEWKIVANKSTRREAETLAESL